MEDDDSVEKISTSFVENSKLELPGKIDFNVNIPSENNTGSSSEYENEVPDNDTLNISKLKKAIVNHELSNSVEKCQENSDNHHHEDSLSDSPKKVNGQCDKSESVISSAESESCDKDGENIDEDSAHNEKEERNEDVIVCGLENLTERKRPSTNGSETSHSENESDDLSSESSPIEFRGFKRRKIDAGEKETLHNICEVNKQIEDSEIVSNDSSVCEPDRPKTVELRRSARNASIAKRRINEAIGNPETKEESGDQLTEYAQYLGLQPTVKFKCGRCGEKHFQSMASLNTHQKVCCKPGMNTLTKPVKPTNDSNVSTNFRITRKVYLCSACGTYYENWKLFLHMRDMHKRHICLFCLGMFSVADKLAEHLLFKHNVHEKACKSPEEFLNLFKGSCYLTCCTCEKMFTEREDFYDHHCKEPTTTTTTTVNWSNDSVTLTAKDIKELSQKCNLCGVKCGHFRTCPNVTTKHQTPQPAANNSSNISLAKYYIPVPASVQKNWTCKSKPSTAAGPPASEAASTEKDYYYDGSAASFCHVDIASDTENRSSPEKSKHPNKGSDSKKYPNQECRSSPMQSSPETQATEEITNDESLGNSTTLKKTNYNFISGESNDLENKTDEKKDKTDDINERNNDSEKDMDDKMSVEEDEGEASSLNRNSDVLNEENNVPEVGKAEEKVACSKSDDHNNLGANVSPSIAKPVDLNENSNDSISNLNDSDYSNDKSNDEGVISNMEEADNSKSDESSSGVEESGDIDNEDSLDNSSVKNEEINENSDTGLSCDDNPCTENDELASVLLEDDSNDNVDDRFEGNQNTIDKSDANESEDSDKLSVILSEDATEDSKNENYDCSTDGKETQNKEENMDTNSKADTETGDHQTEMECDNTTGLEDNENESFMPEETQSTLPKKDNSFKCDGVRIQLASEEVMAMALTLEDKMDSLSSQSVVKECVRTSCTTCSYCSHAVKIGVNGKQIAMHLLTEHRYMPVKNETIEDVIERLKASLDELQDIWFNTDSYDSSDKSCFVPYDHTYECFQCNFVTNAHKDLYIHKRKVHQKTIMYCSMCKENFYSYSEILCHMCPGTYDVSKDILFRCCLCECDRFPSAFRMMVHLRKTHHTCDICLEIAGDQQKLSAHMVKHKLHHLCYRCGIAYRNKPDIMKHLFWKHGTESVLCKKCLQKKWPHVYHFCVPPSSFICEECNLSFSKAVYLKVHKRLHINNLPYQCSTCESKFVSKKLLVKHEKAHEVISPDNERTQTDNVPTTSADCKYGEQNEARSNELLTSAMEQSSGVVQQTETTDKSDDVSVKLHKKKSKKDKDKKTKPVVDVYDLPPLNLSSESDDSDDDNKEREVKPTRPEDSSSTNEKEAGPSLSPQDVVDNKVSNTDDTITCPSEVKNQELNTTETKMDEDTPQPCTVVDGIWDNFHTYKAEQEKRENLDSASKQSLLSQLDSGTQQCITPKDAVLGDHDYCIPNIMNDSLVGGGSDDCNTSLDASKSKEHSSSIDHDYCTQKDTANEKNSSENLLNTSVQNETHTDILAKKKQKSPKKKTSKHHNSSSSSDSSSDSDSSSCSCGTNCSCTSSSSNSSSSSSSDSDSSSSEGRHNTDSKREKRKDKLKNKKKSSIAVKANEIPPAPPPVEEPIVHAPVELEDSLIKESDLETDESATDEDFYDQYPQKHANQILAEKRNQLMVLAAVAPTVNNGTASPPVPTNINIDPISSPKLEIVTPPATPVVQTPTQKQSKRKVKTKKRRKSLLSGSRNRSASKQLNLVYNTPQPSTSFSTSWQPLSSQHSAKAVPEVPSPYTLTTPPTIGTPVSNVSATDNQMFLSSSRHPQKSPAGNSETNSSKRFSKRRRVRNKFYGYSSDEEEEHQSIPPLKWKKTTQSEVNSKHVLQQQQVHPPQPYQSPVSILHQDYNHSNQQPKIPPQTIKISPSFDDTRHSMLNDSVTKRVNIEASSDSSSGSDEDSDSDSGKLSINQQRPNVPTAAPPASVLSSLNPGTTEKDDKLYCYCQCPYDEVSEMIACDGIDCTIEWFHFECVGIMVPPKGKWYCPDCRKRRGLS